MMSSTKLFLTAIFVGIGMAATAAAEPTIVIPADTSNEAPKLRCVNKTAEAAKPKVVLQIDRAVPTPGADRELDAPKL